MVDQEEKEEDQKFSSNSEEKPSKSFWFFDLIEAKAEQLKPMLNTALTPDVKDRLFLDQLKKEDVLVVIQTIFDNPTYLWSSKEIIQAWGKSRSVKDNQKSDYFREQGNEHVKSGNNIKSVKQLLLYSKGFFKNLLLRLLVDSICCSFKKIIS